MPRSGIAASYEKSVISRVLKISQDSKESKISLLHRLTNRNIPWGWQFILFFILAQKKGYEKIMSAKREETLYTRHREEVVSEYMKFAITERLQEIFLSIQTVSDGTKTKVHALNSQQWWAMKAPG